MAITYTTIDTENLGDDQVRYVRAYNVTNGVAFNVIVVLTIHAPYQPDAQQYIADSEIFVPSITVAQLSGYSFTTVDDVDLGAGQHRLVRELSLPGGGVVRSIVRTSMYKRGEQTKTVVTDERLHLQYIPTP